MVISGGSVINNSILVTFSSPKFIPEYNDEGFALILPLETSATVRSDLNSLYQHFNIHFS